MSTPITRNPYQVDPLQAEHEARAKIFWGDSREDVVKYLMMQGVTGENAAIMVDSMLGKRAAAIRTAGIKKIIIGSLAVCFPIAAWFYFMHLGVLPVKLFALTVMVGLWGAWKLINGIIMAIAPRIQPGEVGDVDE